MIVYLQNLVYNVIAYDSDFKTIAFIDREIEFDDNSERMYSEGMDTVMQQTLDILNADNKNAIMFNLKNDRYKDIIEFKLNNMDTVMQILDPDEEVRQRRKEFMIGHNTVGRISLKLL